MIITPVLVTRGLLFDRGFTSRKNTIIHCFHGSYSSRGFTFLDTRSPLRTIPVKGLVRPAAQRGLGLNGTPTSILWNGDDDRRRHLHTRQALALLLREPRSKEKPLAGACSASSQRRREIPEACTWSQEPIKALWTTTPPTQVWTACSSVVPHTRDKISL